MNPRKFIDAKGEEIQLHQQSIENLIQVPPMSHCHY